MISVVIGYSMDWGLGVTVALSLLEGLAETLLIALVAARHTMLED